MSANWNLALDSFLLAFPALFSIVNPLGGALIYSQVTAARSHDARVALAGRVAFYSALVMILALAGGAYVLNFFGVTLAALRIAGGFIVAEQAWQLLSAPDRSEARKSEQASGASNQEDVALFPLTIPFTAGPGTISVAITLGSTRPPVETNLIPFFVGQIAAAIAMAIIVWLAYRSADRIVALMGPSATRTVSRLAAFLLLCIGTQILLNGLTETFAPSITAP